MFTKKWTGNLVGLMHDYKISKTDLANELGVSREYVSMVLNEHRKPFGAQEQFESAANNLIKKREAQAEKEPG